MLTWDNLNKFYGLMITWIWICLIKTSFIHTSLKIKTIVLSHVWHHWISLQWSIILHTVDVVIAATADGLRMELNIFQNINGKVVHVPVINGNSSKSLCFTCTSQAFVMSFYTYYKHVLLHQYTLSSKLYSCQLQVCVCNVSVRWCVCKPRLPLAQ